jgi:hypothetical protein
MNPSELTPSELWLGLRMAGWSLLVPLLKYALPLPSVVRIMAGSRRVRGSSFDASRIVQLGWWTSRLQLRRFPDNCLERSLVTYRFLSRAGADPRLVVGVRSTPEQARGHVWVTLDGRPVHESRDSLRGLTPLIEFGQFGAIVWRSEVAQTPASTAV